MAKRTKPQEEGDLEMNEVAAILRQLEDGLGRLVPADVVAAASDPDSPLHDCFEWDDGEAARKYRLDQARALIRSIKFEVVVNEIEMTVPSYVRDPDRETHEAGYRNVARIRTEDENMRSTMLAEMGRVVQAAARARNLAHYFEQAEAVEQIGRLANAVRQAVKEEPRAQH